MLRQCSLRLVFLALLIVATLSPTLWADIYEWEWVDPADPSQGKQQSTTLCPDGAGLVPVPGLYVGNRNLTQAYLAGANLTGAYFERSKLTNADLSGATLGSYFWYANLTNANLTGANLTGADFCGATLTDANLTGATIVGASFSEATGFTRSQFESTASYASGELNGVDLSWNNLSSWNFAGKNLTGVDFYNATLTNADLTGATIIGGDFASTTGFTRAQFESTASYVSGKLMGVRLGRFDLSSCNFAGKNLTGAGFYGSTLTNADLTGAMIAGANFFSATSKGFTQVQFESTASYISGDLNGICLGGNNLSSWNFVGKNLANVDFYGATLTNAVFSGATIAGACFYSTTDSGFTRSQFESTASYASGELCGVDLSWNNLSSWNFAGKNLTGANFHGATLTNADLTGADARRALLRYSNTILDNFVRPDGRVEGLGIAAGESFRVWDFDGVDTDGNGELDTMLGITVGKQFAVDVDGLLIVGLEDEQWGSTIDFDAGIGVDFGGTLEIELRGDFLPMPGDQWQLFDFTGVTPMGGFDTYVLPSVANGQWDTSHLMNDGVLSFNAVPEPSAILLLATLLAAGIVPVKWRK